MWESTTSELLEQIEANVEYNLPGLTKTMDPTGNICLIKMDISDGMQAHMHFHDWIEFCLVLEGSQWTSIGPDHYYMKPGDFLMIGYSQPHAHLVEKQAKVIYLQIRRAFLHRMVPRFHSETISCNSCEQPQLHDLAGFSLLKEFFLKGANCFSSQMDDRIVEFYGYFYLFFNELIRSFQRAPQVAGQRTPGPDRIREVQRYIHHHYMEDLSLQQLADQFALSPQYLSKIFSAELGVGYKEYLNKVRLCNAVYLLFSSDASIAQIGADCGFSEQKSFIRAFKAQYGTTPLKYRKKYTFLSA